MEHFPEDQREREMTHVVFKAGNVKYTSCTVEYAFDDFALSLLVLLYISQSEVEDLAFDGISVLSEKTGEKLDSD